MIARRQAQRRSFAEDLSRLLLRTVEHALAAEMLAGRDGLLQRLDPRAKLLAGVAPKAIWDDDVPALTALIYLVINGSGMAARQRGRGPVPEPSDVQIIHAPTPVDQIAQAKALLDSGAITADEFAALKAKALG